MTLPDKLEFILPASATRRLALAAAQLGEELVDAVRAGNESQVEELLETGSPAALALDLFGLAFFRQNLRLDDRREAGLLTPYDLQMEDELALLELGVINPLMADEAEQGRAHLVRLFGSGLLLRRWQAGWRVTEVFPVNAGGSLHLDDPTDQSLLAAHQGRSVWPLHLAGLDQVEVIFLRGMQARAGRFNLAELFNAVRMWRDFKAVEVGLALGDAPQSWAAGVEYLISVFDYHTADPDELAGYYEVSAETITDHARELSARLGVTQFDETYSLHPDSIAHYRQLFGELGIDPRRDEQIRQAHLQSGIFNSIEVAPDDDTFFGPN